MSQEHTGGLSQLLPSGAFIAEQFGILSGTLWEKEREDLGCVAPKRQMEFAAGRTCAREALARLGVPACAIPRGRGREPVWPEGVVGSITHCEGYCAAAVAYAGQVPSLGIDAEPDEPLPGGVLPMIARKEEVERLLRRRTESEHNMDRILFSAKESTYKAWYPLAQRWLNFDDVCIDIVPGSKSFSLELLGQACSEVRPMRFAGRYMIRNGLILTAVVAHDS